MVSVKSMENKICLKVYITYSTTKAIVLYDRIAPLLIGLVLIRMFHFDVLQNINSDAERINLKTIEHLTL